MTTATNTTSKAKTVNISERIANDAVSTVQQTAQTFAQAAENIISNAASMFQAGASNFNNMNNEFGKMVRDYSEKTTKARFESLQDMNQTVKQNMNTCAQAMHTYAKSIEHISREMFSFTQNLFENNLAATRNLLACRNAQEAVDIQTNLAKNNIENVITECTRISHLCFDAANKSFQPIQEQMNQNIDKMAKAA